MVTGMVVARRQWSHPSPALPGRSRRGRSGSGGAMIGGAHREEGRARRQVMVVVVVVAVGYAGRRNFRAVIQWVLLLSGISFGHHLFQPSPATPHRHDRH